MKVISFSLYGDDPMYECGLKENLKLCKLVYPDWEPHVFVERMYQGTLDAHVHYCGDSLDHSGMLWRFQPFFWPEATHCIVRDADSRVGAMEAAAVNEWLISGMLCHAMHDHPHHTSHPISGGMFGMVCNILPKFTERMLAAKTYNKLPRVGDMDFLAMYVWPLVAKRCLRHSSVPVRWPYKPFPVVDRTMFIGQRFEFDNKPKDKNWR